MEKRHLGKSGIEIAPLVFGGNVFGWTVNEATSFKLLDAFAGEGFNMIDTADIYSRWVPGNKGGESETIIGRWMKARGNRDRIALATKVGGEMPTGKGLRKARIVAAVEESLQRLQTDYIDVYQSHFDDQTVGMEETMEAFDLLRNQGKVRAIGASNFTPERLQESFFVSSRWKYPKYASLQPEYNLYDRQAYEQTLEKICEDNSLGVIPYYSLASGFLTGKYRTPEDIKKSQRGGGAVKRLTERGLKILAALDEVSAQQKVKPATIALAWLIARPSITAPIASATTVEQLQDLTKAAQIKLTAAQIEQLNQASCY